MSLSPDGRGPATSAGPVLSLLTPDNCALLLIDYQPQAGAVPVTWLQVLLELQRDWARGATAGAVSRVIVEHGGTFGVGMQFGQAVGWTGPKTPAR